LPQVSSEGVIWDREILPGNNLTFLAKDIRREHTGVHANIGILFRSYLLAFDVFNIGRNEERQRLSKSAWSLLGKDIAAVYDFQTCKHDLDAFCLAVPRAWEESRWELDTYDVDQALEPLRFVLRPYILHGAGTIMFAPPGSGKSYMAMFMALSIGGAPRPPWHVEPRPVLYINLERSGESMRRRFHMLAAVLGVRGRDHRVQFLNARGASLQGLNRRLQAYRRDMPDAVAVVDSISRAGFGSLTEDETANRLVDMLNGTFGTWLGIGHTTRASDDHVYGSIHFDAGEDIGVKLSSERVGRTLGVSLTVVKSNDTAIPDPAYYAFEFSEGEDSILEHVRATTKGEFPNLLLAAPVDRFERLLSWLWENGPSKIKDIAKATGISESHIGDLQKAHPDKVVRVARGEYDAYRPG